MGYRVEPPLGGFFLCPVDSQNCDINSGTWIFLGKQLFKISFSYFKFLNR